MVTGGKEEKYHDCAGLQLGSRSVAVVKNQKKKNI